MTLKHLAEGLMQATGARCQNHCTKLLGLPQGLLTRMQNGTREEIKLTTFLHMADASGLPVDLLAEWCRLPHGQVLGRVQLPEKTVRRAHDRVTIQLR